MHLRHPARHLALALLLALPARAHADAPDPDPLAHARQLYTDGQYPQAARLYEQTYRDTGNLGALYNAGICRHAAGAGHEAHALYDWARYLALAPAVAPEERADIDSRSARARELTTPVELRYDYPPAAPDPTRIELHRGARDPDPLIVDLAPGQRTLELRLGVGAWTARVLGPEGLLHSQPFNITRPAGDLLTLRMAPAAPDPTAVSIRLGPTRALTRGITLHWEGPEEPPPLETTKDPDRTWYLPPGAWVLHAGAPGFRPESRLIDVDRTPTELDLTLRRHPHSTARLALSLTTGLAGLGLLAGGLAYWHQGRESYKAHLDNIVEPIPGHRNLDVRTLSRDILTQSTGMAIAGAGLGAHVVAITEAARGGRRALLVEMGLGVAMTASGAIGAGRVKVKQILTTAGTTGPDLDERRTRLVPLYSLLGAGAGMAAASLIAVITHAAVDRHLKHRRAALSLWGTSLRF